VIVLELGLSIWNNRFITSLKTAILIWFDYFKLSRFTIFDSIIVTLLLRLLKINRLTGLQGETGPETAGPVNGAVIQCLHITAPAHKFRYRLRKFSLHYSTCQSKETSAMAFSTQYAYCENTCLTVGRRSVISTSLDINLPSQWHRRFHCDACNLDVGSWQVSNFAWLQLVIEINARATAVALRPTAVSDGWPANRREVQWQWVQRRR